MPDIIKYLCFMVGISEETIMRCKGDDYAILNAIITELQHREYNRLTTQYDAALSTLEVSITEEQILPPNTLKTVCTSLIESGIPIDLANYNGLNTVGAFRVKYNQDCGVFSSREVRMNYVDNFIESSEILVQRFLNKFRTIATADNAWRDTNGLEITGYSVQLEEGKQLAVEGATEDPLSSGSLL